VAVPCKIFDIQENMGWINIGITKDTAEFAVQSICNWWYKMGIYYHNNADSLLITADGGGSNSSKWNKIEHRLFSYISKNWRGRPLVSYQIIVSLIANTTTKKGLQVACEIDDKYYETGIEITEKQWEELNICPNEFHGEWNYKILPEWRNVRTGTAICRSI
jgi:hypothetical protein